MKKNLFDEALSVKIINLQNAGIPTNFTNKQFISRQQNFATLTLKRVREINYDKIYSHSCNFHQITRKNTQKFYSRPQSCIEYSQNGISDDLRKSFQIQNPQKNKERKRPLTVKTETQNQRKRLGCSPRIKLKNYFPQRKVRKNKDNIWKTYFSTKPLKNISLEIGTKQNGQFFHRYRSKQVINQPGQKISYSYSYSFKYQSQIEHQIRKRQVNTKNEIAPWTICYEGEKQSNRSKK